MEKQLVLKLDQLGTTRKQHRKRLVEKEPEPDSPTELEEDLLKDQDRASGAQDGERLPREHGVGHARQRRPEQGLQGALRTETGLSVDSQLHSQLVRVSGSHDVSSGGLVQQASEGDDGRHAGAVQEEHRGHALQAAGVPQVAPQERKLPADVLHQTPEDPGGERQSGACTASDC